MIIGITGGIGSGKSLVASILRVYGFPVYDSDTCAKSLYDEDAALRADMVRLFGKQIYADGRLDRKRLAATVFADNGKLAQLDALVHPAVFRDFAHWRAAQYEQVLFVESAILLQTDFRTLVDRVVVVDAPADVRVARAVQRDGATESAIERRMSAQLSSDEMRAQADFVIENDGQQSLLAQVDALVRTISAA